MASTYPGPDVIYLFNTAQVVLIFQFSSDAARVGHARTDEDCAAMLDHGWWKWEPTPKGFSKEQLPIDREGGREDQVAKQRTPQKNLAKRIGLQGWLANVTVPVFLANGQWALNMSCNSVPFRRCTSQQQAERGGVVRLARCRRGGAGPDLWPVVWCTS